jgi:CXCXC repeat
VIGCTTRVSRPGWNPNEHFNGCGAAGDPSSQLLAKMAQMFAEANFTPACNDHDICYSTCNSVRSACDDKFRQDLIDICVSTYGGFDPRLRRCTEMAGNVSRAVRNHGEDAYNSAQEQACILCCDSGQGACNDKCVDLQNDDFNCGACGVVCNDPWGAICENGECKCPPGQCNREGLCVGPENVACDPPKEFDLDFCLCLCPSGLTNCADKCVDINTDKNNCGNCGNTCSGAQTCQGGQCGCPESCNPPRVLNPETCQCECAVSCPEGQSLDPNTCECQPECQVTCDPPQILNPESCQCECPISCPEGQFPDENCECQPECQETCSAPQVLNPETCECECPVSCDPPLVPNPETCQCECPASCDPPKVTNPETCECECPVSCDPPQVPNPETCQCECPVSCDPPKVLNPDSCQCECPGQTCAPPRVLNPDTCQCECPSGQSDCGGRCVDTSSDKNNCGSCGNDCFAKCGCQVEGCNSTVFCCGGGCIVTLGGTFGCDSPEHMRRSC